MKTQISDIIIGGSKTEKATPVPEREERFAQVLNENPEYLNIKLNGAEITKLKINATLSGKTKWYSKDLNYEEATKAGLYKSENENEDKNYGTTQIIYISVYIDDDTRISVVRYGRRSIRCAWRTKSIRRIDNKYVEILD